MDGASHETEQPKKRRRRHPNGRVLPARLILDDSLQGNIGQVPEHLWNELSAFDIDHGEAHRHGHSGHKEGATFVALSPCIPLALNIEKIPWTLTPVQKQVGFDTSDHDQTQRTIRLPANSSCGRFFLNHLKILDPNRHLSPVSTAVDVHVVIAKPLALDTVYVSVEKNLLKNVDDAQKRFGGGFNGQHTIDRINDWDHKKDSRLKNVAGEYWNTAGAPNDRLAKLLREAVATSPIIHVGSLLALPLPSHPITHISPPSAIVSACEPVAQGLISLSTRIVVVQAGVDSNQAVRRTSPRPAVQHVVEDDAEDTSNEQFYSAAEDREDEFDSEANGSSEQSDTDVSSQRDSDEISDDSLEDMISLTAPDLCFQRLRDSSATTHATPRPGGQRYTGTHTPGSLYSGYSTTTARPGRRPGKVCRVEPLLQQIPTAALHPRPNGEDDRESFVFVDINTLTRIGCFSGDWVRLEKCKRPYMNGTISFNLDGIGNITEDPPDSRLVRIFGLSNLAPRQRRYTSAEKNTSQSILSSTSLTPAVYIPPVLLHNLGGPSFVKVSTLPKSEKSTLHAAANPPLAKEVSLRKIATPLSTNKEVQSSLLANLKQHFEQHFRILKTGDLIAIALDEEAGRATFNPSQAAENSEEIATALLRPTLADKGKPNVAWFVVDQMLREEVELADAHVAEDPWGGILMVDFSRTRMAQAGNCIQGIPDSLAKNAAIWLRVKKIPQPLSILSNGLEASRSHWQPIILPLQKRLSNLITTAISPRALSLGLPPLAILLHSTQRRIGKSYLASSACATAGMHTFTVSAQDVLADGGSSSGGGDMKTEISLKTRIERASSCGSPCTALLITHLEMLTADRMVPTLSEAISDSRVLIATTGELEKLPAGIRSLFNHEFEVNAPSELDRGGILHNACLHESLQLDPSVDLGAVALKTAALVAGDLVDVVQRASLARERRLEKLAAAKGVARRDILYSGGSFVSNIISADFDDAIGNARANFSDSIGAPKIPTVTWEDVGGLADQKSSIVETISLPLTHPELFAKGMRKRSGILFYGPPGTGKTLLAKAIATEFSLNFFSVKGPELLNMYIGESEANVRRVFQRARDARPCVVFFDELDSVAPKRGNQGDSGGVMDRIVSQLLAELDGMSTGGSSDGEGDDGANGNAGGVFVIGATNRPDLLDPALLRPGRFDKMLYLGVASTHEQQVTILEALTRKFTLAAGVDLTRVASRLPFTYTGADLYALCSDAMLKAITKKTRHVDVKVRETSRARGEDISTGYYFDHLATPDDTTVVVGEDDFAAAQKELAASVSAKELAHFERIRKDFEQQDVSSTAKETRPSSGPPRLTTWSSLPIRQQNPSQTPSSPSSLLAEDLGSRITSKTKENAKGIANPDSGPDDSDDSDASYEKAPTTNGAINGSKGKGKAKSKAKGKTTSVDGFIDAEEQDLYA